jgi:DNA-directed RNA polymerase specialized sigma24 family protein
MNARQSQHPSFALVESDAAYFGKIPAQFLKPLKLLHHEKMNYREIAQQTELPAGTVKSRIFRAREIIRQLRAEEAARNETWQEPVFQ